MGLTAGSTGTKAADTGLEINRENETDRVIALAGNPNVGKSTVFNELTGLNQHTGNWPGKTVTNAQGKYTHQGREYILVDIPGTYSLMAHSAEEQVARDFICFGDADAVVVVCDATCLERNLNLVLQTIEITDHVIVCVNLMDEAEKKHIHIDFAQLEENLGVPVVGTSARSRKGLDQLVETIAEVSTYQKHSEPIRIHYTEAIEQAIGMVEPVVSQKISGNLNTRWISLKLIDEDETLLQSLDEYLGFSVAQDEEVSQAIQQARDFLQQQDISESKLKDLIVSCIVMVAEGACQNVLSYDSENYNARDRKIDKWLTSKWTGIPIMLLLLAVIFWLTITGANYPSQLLSQGLFWVQDRLTDFFTWLGTPEWVHGVLVLGVYRVLAWVVSVMLPPMAIFFPLFTLLEDLGYLPRVAFNLDKHFKKCCACGKQALTMCMGFGCNAAGVVGARIIDSPRERLIAIVTNNFVPCNGRFAPSAKGQRRTWPRLITTDCADRQRGLRRPIRFGGSGFAAVPGVPEPSTTRDIDLHPKAPGLSGRFDLLFCSTFPLFPAASLSNTPVVSPIPQFCDPPAVPVVR